MISSHLRVCFLVPFLASHCLAPVHNVLVSLFLSFPVYLLSSTGRNGCRVRIMPCNKFTVLSVLYAFASTSCLFKYLKVRYSQKLVQDLNYVVRLKGKCVRSKEGIKFLRDCLDFRVVPSSIKTRVKKAKPKHPHSIERAFLRDELEKKEDFSKKVKEEYPRKLQQVCHSLSLMDRLRVCKLLNKTRERLLEQIRTKNTKTMNWLIKSQLGQGVLHHQPLSICLMLKLRMERRTSCVEDLILEFLHIFRLRQLTPSLNCAGSNSRRPRLYLTRTNRNVRQPSRICPNAIQTKKSIGQATR